MSRKANILRLALGFAAIAALAVPASSAAASSCPNSGVLAGTTSVAAFNDSVLCLLNNQRTANGLAPLSSNDELAAAALGHSASMKANSYFQHDSPDGTSFSDRIAETGYLRGAQRWVVGENIAWGSLTLGTPQALMTAWMNSPEHRANILEPAYKEIGVGTVWGSPNNPNTVAAAIVDTDFGFVKAKSKGKKSKRAKKARRAKKAKRARAAK
jgi:uncharacterized protein YkwD